jgi:hypothetical protein
VNRVSRHARESEHPGRNPPHSPPVQARGRLWTPAFRGSDDSGDMRLRRSLIYARWYEVQDCPDILEVIARRSELSNAGSSISDGRDHVKQSTRSAKTKVIHAGFLLADPDIEPKSEQSILIEGERIKAVSGGFIDPPPESAP